MTCHTNRGWSACATSACCWCVTLTTDTCRYDVAYTRPAIIVFILDFSREWSIHNSFAHKIDRRKLFSSDCFGGFWTKVGNCHNQFSIIVNERENRYYQTLTFEKEATSRIGLDRLISLSERNQSQI